MVEASRNAEQTVITLSPNRSATWQQTKWVIALMVCFVMIIALAWTFVGAWIVLPFAGLEVGLFALLMYKVSIFTHSIQVIEIGRYKVNISSGYRKRKQKIELNREDLDVYYSQSDNDWELPKISLCSGKQKILIGDFLNLEDRTKLKNALEDAGLIVCRNKWWAS